MIKVQVCIVSAVEIGFKWIIDQFEVLYLSCTRYLNTNWYGLRVDCSLWLSRSFKSCVPIGRLKQRWPTPDPENLVKSETRLHNYC